MGGIGQTGAKAAMEGWTMDDGCSGVIRGGRSQYGKSQDRSVPFRVSRVKSKKDGVGRGGRI